MRPALLAFLLSFCFVYMIILLQADNNKANITPKITEEKAHSSKEIIANLDQMKVYLMENSKIIDTFEIVSVGRPGSFYETPTGSYTIETKEKNHFSNLGKVHMPFSMQFFGNFFIHGIPYHPDGTRVSSFYSGGCIRMEDIDAEKIYNFSSADPDSPTILKIIREQKYTASDYKESWLTRESSINIMTALISLESIDQNKDLKGVGNIKDALVPLLKENNQNVATSISKLYGEKDFVKKMNKKALAIGLTDTTYNSTRYTDEKSTTTVTDSIKLLKYIENNKSYIYNILDL